MEPKAQGFVEVTGYVAAIEAADAMAKAAEVAVVMAHKVDGPDVCVICEGDVDACKAAVDAGAEAVRGKGTLITTNIIPGPDRSAGRLRALMGEMQTRKAAKKAERPARRKAVLARLAGMEDTPPDEPAVKPAAGKKYSRKTAPGK
jgi:microcompartment protein CcmL/EutN